MYQTSLFSQGSRMLGYLCLLCFVTVIFGDSCGYGWTEWSSFCYKFEDQPTTWFEALASCQNQGANLVSIHSLREHDFVTSKSFELNLKYHFASDFTRSFCKDCNMYIGLSKYMNYFWKFGWTDHTPLNFTKLSPGEPNNQQYKEHCATLLNHQDSRWLYQPCDY